MREFIRHAAKQEKQIFLLGCLFAVVFLIMVAALAVPQKARQGAFVPPAFEEAAMEGAPHVPEGLGYSAPFQDGMAYRFAVCGNVTMEGSRALVYLTNPAENAAWIKLRIFDESGNMLGETGLLKQNQYVQYVALNTELDPGTPVRLKIMGYEPEIYTSAGSVILNTQIGGATP